MFPKRTYEDIIQVLQQTNETHHNESSQFYAAWKAVDYRFRACMEHSAQFTESIKRAGNAPSEDERYMQDKELFEFIVSGSSCLESLFYGIYAIGSILNSTEFPMATEEDRQKIDPRPVVMRYKNTFFSDAISGNLQSLLDSAEYKEWNKARNVLTHRIVPPRHFYIGGPKDGKAEFSIGFDIPNMSIDENTMSDRLEWLTQTIESLMNAVFDFVGAHFCIESDDAS